MDIFCQTQSKLKNQIIDQTDNFYLIHDGYPLMEGHLLLIPKKHFDCYLILDKSLMAEFVDFKNKAIKFLRNIYKKGPVIFEHGVAGQTVPHAHLHFLPTDRLIVNQLKSVGKEIKFPSIPYLYFEYKERKKYFQPNAKIQPGLIHSILYPALLNRPKDGKKRSKDLNIWLTNVKNYYLQWQKKFY